MFHWVTGGRKESSAVVPFDGIETTCAECTKECLMLSCHLTVVMSDT